LQPGLSGALFSLALSFNLEKDFDRKKAGTEDGLAAQNILLIHLQIHPFSNFQIKILPFDKMN